MRTFTLASNVDHDVLICLECEHFDREYSPECDSCPHNGVYMSAQRLILTPYLNDGCKWVQRLPALS